MRDGENINAHHSGVFEDKTVHLINHQSPTRVDQIMNNRLMS